MSRRQKGTGSIWQSEADKSWHAQLELGVVDGRRVRRRFRAKTRKQVADKLREAFQRSSAGLSPASDRLTVGTYLARWLRDAAGPSIRPATYRGYESMIRVHLTPSLGTIRLAKLSILDVQAYLRARLAEGLSTQTVRHHLALLRTALGQAVSWGMLSRNVAALTKPPRLVAPLIVTLSGEQARALLAQVTGDRLAAAYVVALSTGLRQGELLGLSWNDVDLRARTLRVSHALQRIRGQFELVEPKTPQSRRTLPLRPTVVAALREHRARQVAERLAVGDAWAGHDLVFTTALGDPIHGSDLTRALQAHLAAAGLPKVTFHSLRHAAASFLLESGADLKTVSEILGHSTIAVTANTYAHLTERAKRSAMDGLDDVLGSG